MVVMAFACSLHKLLTFHRSFTEKVAVCLILVLFVVSFLLFAILYSVFVNNDSILISRGIVMVRVE